MPSLNIKRESDGKKEISCFFVFSFLTNIILHMEYYIKDSILMEL